MQVFFLIESDGGFDMFVLGKCIKCESNIVFDISNLGKDEVETLMKKHDFGECKVGWHVEVGKMADYYVLDWSQLFETRELALECSKSL